MFSRRPLLSISAMATCVTVALAQSTPPSAASSQPAAAKSADGYAAPASAPAKGPPGPIYLPVRYDDNYSYLDGPPGSYQKDLFDPLKNIHLAKDWRLNIGGEVRERMELETNKNFGARDPTADTFLLHRTAIHAALKYRDSFGAFVEGIDNAVFDRDLAQAPGQENRFDLNQGFLQVKPFGDKTPLTLRGGRQEMTFGAARVIAAGDWGNVHRRFDGFRAMYNSPTLDVDVFWTKPVIFATTPFDTRLHPSINEGMNRKPDHYREEQQFFGTYATYKGIPKHTIDAYALGLTDNGFLANANNRLGDLTLYTLGGRFAGATGNFDYDVEGNGQWGKWAGDDVKAWWAALDTGYTFKPLPWTPRLGAGFDYASGDDTPRDGTHETHNQLFVSSHTFNGYLDVIGPQNLISPNINLTLKPLKNVTAKVYYYHYWLASNLDSAYNKGGGSARRNVSGSSGNDLGDELDLSLSWQVDVHSQLLVGVSHFWPGNFINSSGFSRDADVFYLQWQFKF